MRTTALVVAIIAGLIPSVISAPAEVMTSSIVAKFGADLTVNNHYGSPRPPWQSGSKPGWYYGSHPEKHPDLPCLTPDNCKWLGQYPQAIHCPHTYPPSHHYNQPPRPLHHYRPPHHSPPPPPPYRPPPPPPHTSITTTIATPSTTDQPTEPTDIIPPYTTPTIPLYTTSTIQPYTAPNPTYGPPSPSSSSPPPPPPSGGYYQTFHDITAAVQADDYMTFGLVDTVEDCQAMCDSVQGCGFVNTYHDVNGKDGSPLLTCALFTLCHGPEDADNRGGQSQPDGSIDFIADSDGWCKST